MNAEIKQGISLSLSLRVIIINILGVVFSSESVFKGSIEILIESNFSNMLVSILLISLLPAEKILIMNSGCDIKI